MKKPKIDLKNRINILAMVLILVIIIGTLFITGNIFNALVVSKSSGNPIHPVVLTMAFLLIIGFAIESSATIIKHKKQKEEKNVK